MVGPVCRSYALLRAEVRVIYPYLSCCRLVLLYLGEVGTLVMLKRYAYPKSSGLFVVVRPRNTEVGHLRAL